MGRVTPQVLVFLVPDRQELAASGPSAFADDLQVVTRPQELLRLLQVLVRVPGFSLILSCQLRTLAHIDPPVSTTEYGRREDVGLGEGVGLEFLI